MRVENTPKGFALVATLMLLLLLLVLATGMLSLSSLSLRNANTDNATKQARANARMAMMIAIGELQAEMGPDMRISAEAAVQDADPATEAIDGVAQPHWLSVYDSWGNWLNGEYTPEGKSPTDVRTIGDTYGSKRAPMFRRWLVSLPDNLRTDVNAAATPLPEEESVTLVGKGSLGEAHAIAEPINITRAYKIKVGDRGSYAWWIGPENHKAKINLAAQQRSLSADQWAVGQGATSEVAVGGISGLEALDIDKADAASLAQRVISLKTLGLPSLSADADSANKLFFDVTDVSSGILANTRSGGLKKDLSLLFENNDTDIAPEYKQSSRYAPEPSIRPHSKDVLAKNAVLPRRPFASWPRMRHYYRMYREDQDTAFPISGKRNLDYTAGEAPYSTVLAPENMRDIETTPRWLGENSYLRFPVLTRYLLIHSYSTERFTDNSKSGREEIAFNYYDTPVVTFWNPYNTPLVMNSGQLGVAVSSRMVWPHRFRFLNQNMQNSSNSARVRTNQEIVPTGLHSANGSAIVFQPGEVKTFSFRKGEFHTGISDATCIMYEGFDPSGIGGVTRNTNNRWKSLGEPSSTGGPPPNNAFFVVETDYALTSNYGGNYSEGNTPGSLSIFNSSSTTRDWKDDGFPPHYQIDWFQKSQQMTPINADETGSPTPLTETTDPLPVGYTMLTLKGISRLGMSASWKKDWRSRNWLHSPPYYFGSALTMSEESEARAHTQRLDSPYEVSFGPTSSSELIKLTGEINGKPWLGFGSNPYEKVTAVPAIELPTAPLSSLASFSGMRMSPGWIYSKDLNPDWKVRRTLGRNNDVRSTPNESLTSYNGQTKHYMYQSGITGGGIGNSFIHPMIPREGIYFHHDNSVSHEQNSIKTSGDSNQDVQAMLTTAHDNKAYSDYWDHALLLNDALWDEYFISSIADQTRAWASVADNLDANIEALTDGEGLPISRYEYNDGGLDAAAVQAKLKDTDAYLKAAEHLTVDGAFNVNSTSVNAWYALFKGIRERKLFYRDSTGALREVAVPAGHIALSRFDTPTTDKETTDLSAGVAREDGNMAWSGVRFLDDLQIRLLAGKCVEQVKRRGPFLNFSEFINRRLEDNEMGLMGALQAAIDYDDASPESGSINYRYKSTENLRISPSDLGDNEYPTPQAVEGSRLAGIPGYVIQSDLLKPIANTLQVRDDTFRIRAYGETLDPEGNVIARAWCEAIVQRTPEYADPTNESNEAAMLYKGNPAGASYDPRWNGEFAPNPDLTPTNRRFGRKFKIKSFRWLNSDEV